LWHLLKPHGALGAVPNLYTTTQLNPNYTKEFSDSLYYCQNLSLPKAGKVATLIY